LGRGYSAEAREFYTKTCIRCHGDSKLMQKNNLTTIAVKTYQGTLHGTIRKLGGPSAGCADCHGAHNILPEQDPKSSINPRNLTKICSKCHQGANLNFTRYIAHPDLSNREKYPLLFWTRIFMVILLLSILVFYWGHTFLWWRKAYWEKQRQLREGHLISERLIHIENPGETYTRFKLRDRLFHLFCIFAFFGLAATGLPIKFPDASWSDFMVHFIGGVEGAILLHHICAFIIIVEFFIFLAYCLHFTFINKKRGKTIKERVLGPYSFLPRKKDWEDFITMGRWFVDQGPLPKFDHWSYYEKFDILAVFWGMVAIGISGALLWSPITTAKIFPGWIINVARIIHSEEALLAIGFIFTIHFFNTHFVPTKWPMNYSIFTGRIYKWEFIEERPIEYDRLFETKELEKLKVSFPNVLGNLLSGTIGITSLIVGLLTVVFIIWAIVY
jgi:cytochrome b subunit of formate dehydrogenase